MRILLTGKNGQLGRCFQDVLASTHHDCFAFDSKELDISDSSLVVQRVSEVKPDIIVNAAAYTAVDNAEIEQKVAYAVNECGSKLLAEQAELLGIPLIHISTDYVFDGEAVEPYKPYDLTNPQGVYGASKLAGEKAIMKACNRHIILRTSWVFSEYGNNFVKTMVRMANERDSLKVVADQYGCPTYAGDLAIAICELCNQYENSLLLPWGTYHYCGDLPTSWHGFARAIFAYSFSEELIVSMPKLTAISSEQYTTKTKRPEYSVLGHGNSKIFDFSMVSNWSFSLKLVIKKLKIMGDNFYEK